MSDRVAEFFRRMPGRTVARPFAAMHSVAPNAGGWFDVTSGRSGRVHRVWPTGGNTARCECEAGERSMPCTHVEAVREFAADVLRDELLSR